MSRSSARSSGGTIRWIDWPIASRAVQPNSRSAPRFHEVITPSSVLLMMASSDEATIAASSDWASILLSSARLMVESSFCRACRSRCARFIASPSTMIGAQPNR